MGGGVGGFAKMREADFEGSGGGGDTPMHTMNLAITLTVILIY